MSQKKDPKSPATTSDWYDVMAPRWDKMSTVLSGTETMRSAGERYLPRHEEESVRAYEERLARSVLYNQTELTLNSVVGRPFSDPVSRKEVAPEAQEWLEDIDLQGNNIDVFCRQWFREGLAKGFSHVLVEFPRLDAPAGPDGAPRERTVADDAAENVRPYWLHVKPENLIAARSELVAGHEIVTHARILETVVQPDGFAEVEVTRVREITPGHVRIWQEMVTTSRRKKEWVVVDEYDFALPLVPLVTYYADRDGFMMASPPMSDLADLNIQHWQSQSDQIAVLTVARFPMLASSGVSGSGDMTVGPNVMLTTSDPQGRFYYVEHSGAAIAAGRQDLLDLEERMAEYGATFLKKRPGSPTATARALDSAESTSPLQDMAVRFNDAMNTALAMSALWVGLDDPGKLSVAVDFGPETVEQADLQALDSTRDRRDISRRTHLAELVRRGILDDEFDEEQDAEWLEEEGPEEEEGPAPPTAREEADAEPGE